MAKKKKAKKRAKRGNWTTKETNLLKKLFPRTATSKIANKLGRSTDTVKKKASRMGLCKAKSYLKSIGRA